MKQFRITSANITGNEEGDCFLAPTDPIHELKIASIMGGLGAEARLAEYKSKVAEENKINNGSAEKIKYMKENNIRPGSVAYVELWYGKQGLK